MLSIHLSNHQMIYFSEFKYKNHKYITEHLINNTYKFMTFFVYNLHIQMLSISTKNFCHLIWNKYNQRWKNCVKRRSIDCLSHLSLYNNEMFFLQLLLIFNICSLSNFETLWTVNDVCHFIFHTTYQTFDLLYDDSEWIITFKSVVVLSTAHCM